ncbi:MAG: LysM peptidoglycan-binding domain-containing protein [Deltaproteobacteria bacterium]|nr:LysM peptidoglycan-binding domain-containing protein [Nannocystaceae bacterium]
MAKTHEVQQGQSLFTIAKLYGLPSWEVLRDHPGNVELIGKRPHPQILHPGDVLEIPEASEGVAVPLDDRTTFRRRRRDTQPLRLLLEHIDGTPMADTEFTLEHARETLSGRTDAGGGLDVELPIEVGTCTITAGAYTWEVDVAHLDPLAHTDDDGASGCAGRVGNLGWCHDPSTDDEEAEAERRALELFQVWRDLPQTGELDAATRAELEKRHGC